MLPLDATLQERSQKLQARRQDVLVAIATLRDQWEVPLNQLAPVHVPKFAGALTTRPLDTTSGLGKAHVKGSYRTLARAVSLSKDGKLDSVPSFVPEWRPEDESNVRPTP